MGPQSDTAISSFELASRATTCRSLYVAMTRGQRDNTVCVITETHDPAEARDILDAIIAVDRADTPATTQRQELATQDHQPTPRCPIPNWLDDLRRSTQDRLEQARTKYDQTQHQQEQLRRRLSDAEQRRQQARLLAPPFDDAVDAANTALTKATADRRALERRLSTARRRDRRSIRTEIAVAEVRVEKASAARLSAVEAAQPTSSEAASASHELTDLRREQQREQLFARWTDGIETIRILEQRLDALDTWRQWASGATIDGPTA